HTRSKRDWSSDVCSSDLRVTQAQLDAGEVVVFINSGLDSESVIGSGNIGIPIEKVRANVRLEFTRQLSSQYVEEGESITIAYMRSEERRVGKECIYKCAH